MKSAFRSGLSCSILLMLSVLILSIFIFNTGSLSAKDAALKKTVNTQSGLNVRDKPDSGGKKLGLVPFGETVEILETQNNEVTVAGKTGHWVKVKWKNINGWAFDAFLGEAATSPLLEHFKGIAVHITGGADCQFTKNAGEDRMRGDCGSSEITTEPVDKAAQIKGDSITFEYTYQECTNMETTEEYPEGNCTSSEKRLYECKINGKKILSTKSGETLETDVSCTLLKTETY